ncbi:MAG: hypothetical protein ACE5J7_04680 [Candidatus Aenigmatarchaeota archaeon]
MGKQKKERAIKNYLIESFEEIKKDFPEIDYELGPSKIRLLDETYRCSICFNYHTREFKNIEISRDLVLTETLSNVWAHEFSEHLALQQNPILDFFNAYFRKSDVIGKLVDKVVHWRTDMIAKSRGYKTTKELKEDMHELAYVNAMTKGLGLAGWSDFIYKFLEFVERKENTKKKKEKGVEARKYKYKTF